MEEPLRQAYQQAGITEREIAIENVHLVRSTNSLEISCTGPAASFSPRRNSTPFPWPKAMPMSASEASPGPLTAQPMTAILRYPASWRTCSFT